jgi:uncharacterized protein YecT (DUF1311 family)
MESEKQPTWDLKSEFKKNSHNSEKKKLLLLSYKQRAWISIKC